MPILGRKVVFYQNITEVCFHRIILLHTCMYTGAETVPQKLDQLIDVVQQPITRRRPGNAVLSKMCVFRLFKNT